MSDNPDIFMPLFLGDFTKHIIRLSDAEIGSYLLILMDYWINGAPPDDDSTLAQAAKCSPEIWEVRRGKLLPFFKVKNGVWTQKRVEEELKKARGRKVKAQRAAKAKQDAIRARAVAEKAAKSGGAPSTRGAPPEQVLGECSSPTPSTASISAPSGQRDTSQRDAPVLPLNGKPAISPEERELVGGKMRQLALDMAAGKFRPVVVPEARAPPG